VTAAVGKTADVTVFGKDLITVERAWILEAEVLLTVWTGKLVFKKRSGVQRAQTIFQVENRRSS
jgi:hypothetical protein